jgi:hypothetical protein
MMLPQHRLQTSVLHVKIAKEAHVCAPKAKQSVNASLCKQAPRLWLLNTPFFPTEYLLKHIGVSIPKKEPL